MSGPSVGVLHKSLLSSIKTALRNATGTQLSALNDAVIQVGWDQNLKTPNIQIMPGDYDFSSKPITAYANIIIMDSLGSYIAESQINDFLDLIGEVKDTLHVRFSDNWVYDPDEQSGRGRFLIDRNNNLISELRLKYMYGG